MSDGVDETAEGNVDIEAVEHFVDGSTGWQLVERLQVYALDLFVDDGTERTQPVSASRGRHLDADIAVSRGSHAVQQRRQQ